MGILVDSADKPSRFRAPKRRKEADVFGKTLEKPGNTTESQKSNMQSQGYLFTDYETKTLIGSMYEIIEGWLRAAIFLWPI